MARRPPRFVALAALAALATAFLFAPRPALGQEVAPKSAATRAPWWTRKDLATPTSGPLAKMWNESLGDMGGLSLSTTGESSTAKATAIRMNDVRTVGRGEGVADLARVDGGHSRVPGSHVTHVLPGELAARYQLPPETIQLVIEGNFLRFRACYGAGLRRNPALAGRVAVRFTIDRVGAVAVAADHGSNLPDADVVSCVVRGFASLSFPPSPDGSATVVYPLVFTPDDPPPRATL